jgi:glycosyltransferase involved in cell wall biosynthesis
MTSLSIIVPCYKQKNYVDQCIQSLLRCEPQPREIIASDNFCPQGTYESISKYDGLVRIVRPQQHLPAVEHFNFLASLSNSEYTSIVCGDDYVYPDYVKVLTKLALRCPQASILRAGFHDVNHDGFIQKTHRLFSAFISPYWPYNLNLSLLETYPRSLIRSAFGTTNPLISWAFNTNAFKKIGFFDVQTDICDWSAFIALSKLGPFVSSFRPIAAYRVGYRDYSELLSQRATTQINSAIHIGKSYIIPELNSLSSAHQKLFLKNYQHRLRAILDQYCYFLMETNGTADAAIIDECEFLLRPYRSFN